MTKYVKSTSWSGRPVDQSNSLMMGSRRQDAQTPLPPAHRKRTCCSLRSDTEKICCSANNNNKKNTIIMGSLNPTRSKQYIRIIIFYFLPPPSCCRCRPHELCSSSPPTGAYLLQGSSERAAEGSLPEAAQSGTAGSNRLQSQTVFVSSLMSPRVIYTIRAQIKYPTLKLYTGTLKSLWHQCFYHK